MLKSVSSVINAIGALNYKGTWNATTNTPTLASGVGTKGDYYVVSVAGTTALDGISNWGIGDWVAFNGIAWQRVEGGADLNGVNLSVSNTSTLDGNVTFGDNLTQGTAARGVNFTANTALAGMTSRLLNWYEEGTFTPVWNGGTVTVNSSNYTRVGRLVTWILDITFGASTSGTDSQLTLPFNCSGSWGGGVINSTDYGVGLAVNVDGAGNRLLFRGADNSSNLPCNSLATKRIICIVTYFA